MEKDKEGEPEKVVELYPAPAEPPALNPIQLQITQQYLEVSRQLSALMTLIEAHWSELK